MISENHDSVYVTLDELAAIAAIEKGRAEEYIGTGWIESFDVPSGKAYKRADAEKLVKAEGICRDFSVSPLAGAIITDLMDKVEALEERIARLEAERIG